MSNEDQLRADIDKMGQLARDLFEQQFRRCGGRKPADPTWGDLEQVERDEWWERALDAAPLLAERDAELERWRTGLRRRTWPTVESVPDGLWHAAELARSQGTEGGDEHDRLLREAAIRMRDLNDAARVLLADRDRVEASRRDWAAEALRLQQEKDENEAPASWDYPHPWRDNGGGDPYYNTRGDCRSCGRPFDDELHDEPFGIPPVAPGPNAPCACVTDEQAAVIVAAGFSRPVCAVHPEERQ